MTTDSTLINLVKGHAVMTSRMSFVFAIILLLFAALLRMADLANVPAGFSEDEIINIRLVDNVRQGDIFVFYPGEDGGREGIYHVFVAFVTLFVGEGTIGFRILSVWLSLLSIAITYTLGRHLFNPIVAVMSAGVIVVNMSNILMARSVNSDATVVFLVSATMLVLARSLPVYRRTRIVTSNVISFATLGALLGTSFYLHPSSLFIVLGCMLYIAHLLYIRHAMFRQRRSYTGFAILVMLIIAMPYLISSINLPQYAAGQRILSHYTDGLLRSIVDGLLSVVRIGDMNPLHNLPGRPLVDAFTGLFALVGIAICIYRRHRPRFMLLLIMGFVCLPAALIVENSPNFARMAVILPQLALFFGIGFYSLIREPIFSDIVFRRMAVAGVLLMLAVNFLWTWQDLFMDWRDNEAVLPKVNGGLGQIAHYLDARGNDLEIVLCNADWHKKAPEQQLNHSEKTLLMMNRTDLTYHEVDCARSLLLTNGGARQRMVLFTRETRQSLHPYLQEWLSHSQPVAGKVPRGTVVELESAKLLADRAGEFITTGPVWYDPEVAGAAVPLPPPIRFGGNLTLLGYEPNVPRTFLPGEFVDVITYWRVEGVVPPDLTLFNHILSDPFTRIANHDVIYVNPQQLHDRDVFIQVTSVQLPATTLPGEYFISVGAYRQSDSERLYALKDDEPYGNRIFLYAIEVEAVAASEESSG